MGGPHTVKELPSRWRTFFPFTDFNSVQTQAFKAVFEGSRDVVLSAPTGAGKTVIFELAIIQQIEFSKSMAPRIVYMSPTKALCQERAADWERKFGNFGITCAELTGDSDWEASTRARASSIIVTTPEKWDSMTRRWSDISNILSSVRVICIDECHAVAEKRGCALEALVGRMKSRGSNIRFIAVSATVPNIRDVAEWISFNRASPAIVFEFGEEYRPIPLRKYVLAVSRPKTVNEFAFNSQLRQQMKKVLDQYSSKLPTLVFCPTRNECIYTADQLVKDIAPYRERNNSNDSGNSFTDKKLRGYLDTEGFVRYGVAIHHGGLDYRDRRSVEEMFKARDLRIICTTSTLAVGVNLPAHLEQNVMPKDGSIILSDMEIIQMMGRSGRPQYDSYGVAVIMTDTQSKSKFDALNHCTKDLESHLHENLAEHFISELSLGTITDISSATTWLKGTFLNVRIKKNSSNYGIASESPEKKLEEILLECIEQIAAEGVIIRSSDGKITATVFCDIMSRLYINYKTFVSLMSMPSNTKLKDMMLVVSKAEEFSTLQIRGGERKALTDAQQFSEVKYGLKSVTNVSEKIYTLIQLVLGGVNWADLPEEAKDSRMDVQILWKHIPRLCQCIVDIFVAKKDAGTLKNAQTLHRSVIAKCWEDTPTVFRQLDGIGDRSVKKLCAAGIICWEQLLATDPHRISSILGQNNIGYKVLKQAKAIPQLGVTLKADPVERIDAGISVKLDVEIFIRNNLELLSSKKNSFLSVLVYSTEREWIEYRRLKLEKLLHGSKPFKIHAKLSSGSTKVICVFAQENMAGNQTRASVTLEGAGISDERVALRNITNSSVIEEHDVLATPKLQDNIKKADDEPEKQKARHLAPDTLLSNENYKCGHSCKNRQACRHKCCKEGVTKPVAKRKKKEGRSAPSKHLKTVEGEPFPISLPLSDDEDSNNSQIDELADDNAPLLSDFMPPEKLTNLVGYKTTSTENYGEGNDESENLPHEPTLSGKNSSSISRGPLRLPETPIPKRGDDAFQDVFSPPFSNNVNKRFEKPHSFKPFQRRYTNKGDNDEHHLAGVSGIVDQSDLQAAYSITSPIVSERMVQSPNEAVNGCISTPPSSPDPQDDNWFENWLNVNVEIID